MTGKGVAVAEGAFTETEQQNQLIQTQFDKR